MKKAIFLLLLATISTGGFAQVVNIKWEKSYGGSTNDEAYDIQNTTDGGYIVVGPAESDDSEVTGHHGTGGSNYDYWVVKLNDTGGIQWEYSFGGSADDIVSSVQQTNDGGYIVAGASESTDGDLSTCSILEYDYWLLKLSSTGAVVWKNCFGSVGGGAFNEAFSVQQTPDSDYIVAGYTNSADSGEVTGFHGNNDYWVIKVSSSGGFLWGKCLGGSSSDIAKCVQSTTDGGYIVVGNSSSTNGDVTGNHGSSDYWVVKLDDTGAIQWEKSYGGTAEDDGKYIRQTFDGGYIVAGASKSINGQVTGHHGDTTTFDFWIVKLDDTGAIQWETSLGGSQNEEAYAIQQLADSGYIVTGASNSIDGNVTGNHGMDDYWVVKLNKSGALAWQKSLGGSSQEEAYAIRQTPDTGFVVAGGSSSTNGDVTGNHGAYDFWVVKLSSCMLSSSPVVVRAGTTLSTSIPYSSYQWMNAGSPITGATNATYTIPGNGQYSVLVIDSNSCSGASVADTIQRLGIASVLNSSTVKIMPNPTTGNISVSGAGLVNISIYNLVGQLVKEAKNADAISIAELPAGMYFIKLVNDLGQVILQDKVVKE